MHNNIRVHIEQDISSRTKLDHIIYNKIDIRIVMLIDKLHRNFIEEQKTKKNNIYNNYHHNNFDNNINIKI